MIETDAVPAAVAEIRRRAPGFVPRLAIITGSGLGGLADAVADAVVIPYDALPGFPRPTVAGHAGWLLLGTMAGLPVAVMQGRAHGYEGGGFAAMTTAIRALQRLGTEILCLTCAAGSLRDDMGPGSLMAITDHINLMGFSPLVGPNDEAYGPRFPDLADAWNAGLRARMAAAAADCDVRLDEGVYVSLPGPHFETAAEVRLLGRLGGDVVGMSTAPECIIARHCGLLVTGVATITNYGAGIAGGAASSHEQTLAAAGAASAALSRLLQGFCAGLATERAAL